MTATYTFDIFSTLDGYGSYREPGDWGGYWGKQGPELVEHRFTQFGEQQRMVFGAGTYREFVELLGSGTEETVNDDWVDPDAPHADDDHLQHPGGTAGLAGRHARQR